MHTLVAVAVIHSFSTIFSCPNCNFLASAKIVKVLKGPVVVIRPLFWQQESDADVHLYLF